MPEARSRPEHRLSGFSNMNSTQLAAGACIVSAGVLLVLLDGGASIIFSAVAGTSAYIIHNMTVDDIPADLKSRYSDEMSDLELSDSAILMGASMLAALGVVISPCVGMLALVAALIFHVKMQSLRYDEIHDLAEELGMA